MSKHYFATPTAAEDTRALPVTIEELKNNLRVEHHDQDALMRTLLLTAVDEIEQYLDESIIQREWTIRLDKFPSVTVDGTVNIELPTLRAFSLEAIRYQNTADAQQTLDPADYRFGKTNGRFIVAPTNVWPTTYDAAGAVEVDYKSGFAQTPAGVPAALKTAITLRASTRYMLSSEMGIGGSTWELGEDIEVRTMLSFFTSYRV